MDINQDGSTSINKSSRERRIKCQMSANTDRPARLRRAVQGGEMRDKDRTGQDRTGLKRIGRGRRKKPEDERKKGTLYEYDR